MGRLVIVLVALGLGVVSTVGCGDNRPGGGGVVEGKKESGKKEEVKKQEKKKEVKKEEKKEPVVAAWKPSPKGPLKIKYQGQLADYWYELLLDADSLVARQGAIALQEIGEEAVPYLEYAAVNEGSLFSRPLAIHHLPDRLSQKCRASWVPMLRLILKDERETIRYAAMFQMWVFGYTECLPDLEKMLKEETNPAYHNRLRLTIERLSKNLKE